MTTMKFVGPSFTLDVPTDWFAFSSPQYQTMFLSPPTADGQRANFTITIQPREDNVTPEQYAKLLHESYAQLNAARDIHEDGAMTVGDVAAYHTVATVRTGPQVAAEEAEETEETEAEEVEAEAAPDIVQQEVIAVVDDVIYVLLAARPAEIDAALGDALDGVFATMLETFRFRQATLTA